MILVNDLEKLQTCIEAIRQSGVLCFDVETNGLQLHTDHDMIGIAFYCDFNGASYYVPFGHGVGTFETTTKTKVNAEKAERTNERYAALDLEFQQLEAWQVFDALEGVLTDDKTYLCHNAQFDLTALWRVGIDLSKAVVLDTMLAARTLYSDFNRSYFKMPDTHQRERGNNTLKWQARLFGLVEIDGGNVGTEQSLDDAIKELKFDLGKNTLNLDKKRHMWALSPETVAPYACQDVELTYQLHFILLGQLAEWGQVDVYKLMCEHQRLVAWRMNRTGFLIDHTRGQELLDEYEKEVAELGQGINFNVNSARDIEAYALERGITLPLTAKGNPKTDKKTLKKYQAALPLIKKVLAIKALNKNVGTYIKKWVNDTAPGEPLHFYFNVLGAVTGRWTSNGQQTPKDTKLKYSPKKLLLPVDPLKQIVEIDYSQLEMRVGAWVAETLVGQGVEMTLTNLIIAGVDMHAYTRDNANIPEILLGGQTVSQFMEIERGHDLTLYTGDEALQNAFMDYARQVAKVPNFAAMYGGGWEALVNILEGISERQARSIMDGWKETYPTVVRAMTILTKEAMQWRMSPDSNERGPIAWKNDGQRLYQYIQYPDLCVPFIRKWSYYSESEKQEKSKDAFNSIVQGTAGFITVESINRALKRFGYLDAHAQVHDSFVSSMFPHQLKDLGAISKIMTDWNVYPRLEVDIEVCPVGAAWGYKEEYVK